jgi:hypothetical protein
MEFGIFSQMHCPPWDDEHSRFMRELEVSEAVEAAGLTTTTRNVAARVGSGGWLF